MILVTDIYFKLLLSKLFFLVYLMYFSSHKMISTTIENCYEGISQTGTCSLRASPLKEVGEDPGDQQKTWRGWLISASVAHPEMVRDEKCWNG